MSTSRSTTPARRAVVRWAWRLFRREWRAQMLVLCLATVAVGAAIVGSTMAVRAGTDTAGWFGNAGTIVQLVGDDPAAISATAQSVAAQQHDTQQIDHARWAVPGSTAAVDVRAFDPTGHLVAPMIGLRSGRYPATADEVALTPGVATLLDARLGDQVSLDRRARTVVGIIDNPARLSDDFALVVPGAIAEPSLVEVFIAHRSGPIDSSPGVQVGIMEHSDDGASRIVLVTVVLATAMALVGLVAAAGFIVVAQRRQRQLGLLAAIGATRQHLQLVMLANGTIVGAVAAVCGLGLGIVGWNLVLPTVQTSAQHHLGRLELAWSAVAFTMVLSVITATFAAWWPARTASRVPVMSALSGRPPRPRPVHRPMILAVAATTAGIVAIIASGATRPHPKPALLVVGLLAVVAGVVLAAPGAIRLAAVPAGVAPLPARLAVRDLARYRARASAALAAVTLGLGIAAGVVVIAGASSTNDAKTSNLPANEVLIHADAERGPISTAPTSADAATLDAAAAKVVEAFGTDATTVPLDIAVAGAATPPVGFGRGDDDNFNVYGPAYVATDAVLAHYGIDPSTIPSGADAITSRTDDVVLFDPSVRSDDTSAVPATQVAALPHDSSEPTTLVTDAAMQRNGWQSQRAGWLVTLPDAPTAEQLKAARAAAASAGFEIETKSAPASVANLQDWATIIGIALALLILVMTTGLLRAEAAGDVRTLTANGAPAHVRRSIAAATAATLALLGAVLGLTGAYLAAAAAFHADLSRLKPVPWSHLAAIVIGLPILAAGLAWLASGREPPAVSRRTLD